MPVTGNEGEPIDEKMHLAWFIMSSRNIADPPTITFAQTTQNDNEELISRTYCTE